MTQDQLQIENPAQEVETRDWWGAGSAGQRPTVGTIPQVVSPRSHIRSRLLPGVVVLCAGTAVFMSTQPWITAHFLRHMSSIYGTDKVVSTAFGINGWATLAAAAALVLVSALTLVSDDRALRYLSGLIAAGLAGLSAYELVRVLQKIHYARSESARMGALSTQLLGRAHVGYGLIVLAAAAGLALVASLLDASSAD
jgi:hypothetical protein